MVHAHKDFHKIFNTFFSIVLRVLHTFVNARKIFNSICWKKIAAAFHPIFEKTLYNVLYTTLSVDEGPAVDWNNKASILWSNMPNTQE
jgi:hypothetical protein